MPVATEVQPGWWVGGCYGHELIDPITKAVKEWSGIIDLTVEFPESCPTQSYLSIPTWDGVPPSPAELEHAATFSVEIPYKATSASSDGTSKLPRRL